MRAKDVMSTPVVTVEAATPAKDVASVLVRYDIGAVPVVDDSGGLHGLVSEEDLLPLGRAEDHVWRRPYPMRPPPRTAGEAMTTDVVTVTGDADVADVVRLMLERGAARVPVVEDGRVVGIISRRDVLRMLARSDASIEAELRAWLDAESELIGSWTATVSHGWVALRGPAEDTARRLATLIAQHVPGVVAFSFED